MNVYLPYLKGTITQRFNENANPLYAGDGLKGHTAYDWGVSWGTPVPNCAENAFCYSILNKNNPDPMKYRSVYTLVEDGDIVYELSYGHFSTITAVVGKTYQPGEVLGLVGNTGDVYSGSHYVTKAEKLAGSKAGAHLHGPQVRPCKKVQKKVKGKHYLSDAKGTYKKDGYYYEVIDYGNGFNGCVSLAPFSTETLASKWKPKVEVVTVEPDKAMPVPPPAVKLTLLQQVLELCKQLLALLTSKQ